MVTGNDSLSEQIYVLSTLQKSFIQDRLDKIGLNELQARTMNYVATYPGQIQTKLARYLGKQNATVTNILKLLEKKGYIIREIPENNERQKKIYISDDGKVLVDRIQTIFTDLELVITDSLDNLEIKNLKAGMKKICTKLQ